MKQTIDSSLRNESLCKCGYYPNYCQCEEQETNPKAIIGSGVEIVAECGPIAEGHNYYTCSIIRTNPLPRELMTSEVISKEDAELICEAVNNNYQALRDSNAELLKAIEEWKGVCNPNKHSTEQFMKRHHQAKANLQSAINKAKSLNQ